MATQQMKAPDSLPTGYPTGTPSASDMHQMKSNNAHLTWLQ